MEASSWLNRCASTLIEADRHSCDSHRYRTKSRTHSFERSWLSHSFAGWIAHRGLVVNVILFIFYLSSMTLCGLVSFALGRMSKGGALGLELARAIRQRDAMEALANKYLETQCVAIKQMKTQQGRAERAEFELRGQSRIWRCVCGWLNKDGIAQPHCPRCNRTPADILEIDRLHPGPLTSKIHALGDDSIFDRATTEGLE